MPSCEPVTCGRYYYTELYHPVSGKRSRRYMRIDDRGANVWVSAQEGQANGAQPHPKHAGRVVTIRESATRTIRKSDVVAYMTRQVETKGGASRTMTQGVCQNGKCFPATMDEARDSGRPILSKSDAERRYYIHASLRSDDPSVCAEQRRMRRDYKDGIRQSRAEEREAHRDKVRQGAGSDEGGGGSDDGDSSAADGDDDEDVSRNRGADDSNSSSSLSSDGKDGYEDDKKDRDDDRDADPVQKVLGSASDRWRRRQGAETTRPSSRGTAVVKDYDGDDDRRRRPDFVRQGRRAVSRRRNALPLTVVAAEDRDGKLDRPPYRTPRTPLQERARRVEDDEDGDDDDDTQQRTEKDSVSVYTDSRRPRRPGWTRQRYAIVLDDEHEGSL